MPTTYSVNIWKTKTHKGKRVTSYYVRWSVDSRELHKSFRNKAQADSFRSELTTAARKGEAFDITTGLPVSTERQTRDQSWYEFACNYTDKKWPNAAATTRRTIAEALTSITVALLSTEKGRPDPVHLRSALRRWAFNTAKREDPECPPDARRALSWAATHTLNVSALTDTDVLRAILDSFAYRLDGQRRAPSVVLRWRMILNNAIEAAVDAGLVSTNSLPEARKKAGKTPSRSTQPIDRRSVVNPVQARTLLHAVRDLGTVGERMVALFGCLYFAGLRPEEAVGLAKHNLSLPSIGWGELHIDRARPYAGRDWTDTGDERDDRQLKQRQIGETRPIPSPPELTALLHEHLSRFGTTPDGRLFVGERNREQLPARTMTRVWSKARRAAFTPDVVASPLAKVPYDLRHAAVSTWLNAGVPATTVAAWAGHSVEVLLKIYAKCLDGEEVRLRNRIEGVLRGG